MNFKTTYVLFGIFAVLLAVFGWALFHNEEGTPTGNYVLGSMHKKSDPMKEDSIDRVELERKRPNEEKIVFVKDAQTKQWQIVEPKKYRADRFAVEGLVRQVYDAQRDPQADQLKDLAKAGLEPPAERITLKKGDREVQLLIGDSSPGKDNAVYYVTSSDDPKLISAVKKSQLDSAFKALAEFRDRDLLSPSSGDIQQLTLSEGKKGPIELKKNDEGTDRWNYIKPPYGRAEYDGSGAPAAGKAPDGVRNLLNDITNLKVEKHEDFVADAVEDLAKYNLDPAKADVLKIAIDRTEEISGEDGKKERKTSHPVLLVGVSKKIDAKGDQYYACLEDDKNVFKLSASKVEPFQKLLDSPGALRDRNLVETGGFKKPDAIDVQNSYGKLEFRKVPSVSGGWKLFRGDAPQAVDDTAVQKLVSELTHKNVVESFVDDPKDKAALGLDKPDVTVSVWLDSIAEDKDDTKDDDKEKDKDKDKKDKDKDKAKKDAKPKLKNADKPSVVLKFGNRKEGMAAVERKFAGDAEGTVVMVPLRLLDQVREGPQVYLDKKVPSFAKDFSGLQDVTRVKIEKGGTTVEVARGKKEENKPAPEWKIEKPEGQAGRKADSFVVDDLLRDLHDLKAEKFVTEKATASQLTDYGLSSPSSKVTITMTKDGKPETAEYDFGKEAGMSGVYMKKSGSDAVWVVGNNLLTAMSKEMQDPKVFDFDAVKVKELRLKGWKDLFGSPTEITFTRKDKDPWVGTGPVKEPDQEKVHKLIDELSRLRAERFVSHNTAPAENQGLDVAKGALQIDVVVEGEKEPYVLTVGAADGDKGFFASSPRLGKDVFDVRKDVFEKVKEKPAYLAK